MNFINVNLSTVLDANSPDQDGSEVVSYLLSGVPSYLTVTGPGSGVINQGFKTDLVDIAEVCER